MPRIVKSVQIKYFRSVHRLDIKSLGAVNVFSGRNDVGKSTLLKALNLFFNGETDWGEAFDFQRDFSLRRLDEVRKSVKGRQFVSVGVELDTPGYEGSLPRSLSLTKTWLRDGIVTVKDDLESLASRGKLPSSLASARTQLGRLLNRIHFEYVPAVRDRSYFQHVFKRLQTLLLGVRTSTDTEIAETADRLADYIGRTIGDLQQDFSRATGISSSIRPPRELGSLFQAFGVSTEVGRDDELPLSLRGDGIQARFLPSVLRFLSDHSTHHFLWGFEEPENSLEHAHAIQLARDLEQHYSSSAQIFVTSHSPAFTTLEGSQTHIFRVVRQEMTTDVIPATEAEVKALEVDLGYLDIYEDLHRQLKQVLGERESLKSRLSVVEREAQQAQLPVVVVEGQTDEQLIGLAWEKLRPGAECPFLVRRADPQEGLGGGASAVRKSVESLLPRHVGGAIAIFDRDGEGRKAFENLPPAFEPYEDRNDAKLSLGRRAAALLIPTPPGREEYSKYRLLDLEHLFSDEVLSRRNPKGHGLEFQQVQPVVTLAGCRVDYEAQQLEFGPDLWKISGGKRVFAEEIAPTLGPGEFQLFEPLLITVEQLLESLSRASPS